MVTWIRWVLAILLLATSAVCFVFRNPFGGTLCAAMAAVVIVWAILGRKKAGLRVGATNITLTIEDPEGCRARVEKTQELTPVGKPLVDIRDRSLFTKGRVDAIEVSPGEIGERMALGKYNIAKVVFKPPLKAGQTVTRRVSYQIHDGFTEDDVSLMFVGDYPADRVVLEVAFPAARRPRRIRASIREEKKADRPAELVSAPDGGRTTWTIPDVKVGVQYYLEWTW